MKLLFLVILLTIVLTGCNKSDLWGYESYSHCMLEVISKQPSVDDDIKTNAKTYCEEKFLGESVLTIINKEKHKSDPYGIYTDRDAKGLDNEIETSTPNNRHLFFDKQGNPVTKEKFMKERNKLDPLVILTDEELFPYMTTQERALFRDTKDLTNEELSQRVKETNKAIKDLRKEVDKRKSKGVWSIPAKAVEDMTDEELFE